MLGKEHVDTLWSKYWLAHTFYNQQKYPEAEELFRQSTQEREKVLGNEHNDTLDSIHLLQESLSHIPPPASTNGTPQTVFSL